MLSTIMLMSLFIAGVKDTIIVRPDSVIQIVNPFLFGSNLPSCESVGQSKAWTHYHRCGAGIWHVPSDTFGTPPDSEKWSLGRPDNDYKTGARNAGIKLLRFPPGDGRAGPDSLNNKYCDWKALVGRWRTSAQWWHSGTDSIYLPKRIQEFGLPEWLHLCDTIGAKACIVYRYFEDTTIYFEGSNLDTIRHDMEQQCNLYY